MPSGKKRKRHKMATHKRKKRLRKNCRSHKNDTIVLQMENRTLMPKWYCVM